MNPTSPETTDPTLKTATPAAQQTASELETRWPSVNLEEQRQLYARIEALRANLLKTPPRAPEDLPPAD